MAASDVRPDSGKDLLPTLAPDATLDVGIVVGETSGDNLGAGLIRALQERYPNCTFRGIAGPTMQTLGATSWHAMDAISVMGFDGLIRGLPRILSIRRDLTKRFLSDPPDVFVGIDVPDFNMGLERRLRDAGIPTVHYVSPTVWAWRGYRIKRIRNAVSHMLALFPFEAAYYRRENVPVTFVGHPMADEIQGDEDGRALRDELGITDSVDVVALLPGSRVSEVSRLAEGFLQAAQLILQQRPGTRFVVPFASERVRVSFENVRAEAGIELAVDMVDGRAREVMAAADVVLLASGTAALEAALLRKPMVVTYRVSAASAALIRRFVHVEHFSMPNHLLPQPRVPELIQENATAPKMAKAVLEWLDNPESMASMRDDFAQIHASLRCDASAQAANAIVNVIREHRETTS